MRKDEFPLVDKLREEAYQQGRADERENILVSIKMSLEELRECGNDSYYYFDSDNYNLVMKVFSWVNDLLKEHKNE